MWKKKREGEEKRRSRGKDKGRGYRDQRCLAKSSDARKLAKYPPEIDPRDPRNIV
jgi:hypothetical protein